MNRFLYRWFSNAISIYVIAWLFEGVRISGFAAAIVAALALCILNILVKPVLIILTLPINILTLGIFTLILNGFILMIVDAFVAGFYIDGFMIAILASIVLTFVNMLITKITKPDKR